MTPSAPPPGFHEPARCDDLAAGGCDLCWRPDDSAEDDDTDSAATAVVEALARSRFAKPILLGCRCNDCPLGPRAKRPSTPVLPEIRASAQVYVIGEAPGRNEETEGAPFVGASGRFLMRVLAEAGLRRADVSLSNALLCRPPAELRAYLRGLSARNKARLAKARVVAALASGTVATDGTEGATDAGAPKARKARQRAALREALQRDEFRPWPSPVDCCRPRVMREAADARAILTLGAAAYAAVTGAAADESGMMAARGYPQLWTANTQNLEKGEST